MRISRDRPAASGAVRRQAAARLYAELCRSAEWRLVGHGHRRLSRRQNIDPPPWRRHGMSEEDRALAAARVLQYFQRPGKTFGPARGTRIVERDGKIGFGRKPQALFDERPRL